MRQDGKGRRDGGRGAVEGRGGMAQTGSSEAARSSPGSDHPVQEGLSPTENSRRCETQPFSISLALKTATAERKAVLPPRPGHRPSCSSLSYTSHFFP